MAVMSARVKSLLASERVKVTVTLSPLPSRVLLLESAMVGATVSMKIGSGVGGLTLPAGSTATMLRLFWPCGSGLVGATLHWPLGPTMAEPMTLPCGSVILMVSPGVPVPVSVGWVTLVMLSVVEPLLLPGAKVPDGAEGPTLSMTTGKGTEGLTAPEGLVSVMDRLLEPWGSGAVGVTFHWPLGPTTAEPITLPAGSVILMVSPG